MSDRSTNLIPVDAPYRGDVVCRAICGRSTLTRLYSTSPLKLLAPTHIGRAAHVVMSSFGGGMVSGDVVPLRFRIERDASCVVATQSSSKVYRSNGQTCVQTVDAVVEDDATLVWLPDPLVCYADSRYEQRQQFDLAPRANLLSLDWLTSGRWARDERWAFESVESRTDVRIADRLVLRETLRLNDLRDRSMRVGRFDCYAVLTMIGPSLAAIAARARYFTLDWPVGREMDVLSSFSPIEGGAVMRILGPRVQVVQTRVRQLIEPLADVIGGDPWARKW